MTAIMRGFRILEVAEQTCVPAASALLADWGAEIFEWGTIVELKVRGVVA